MLIKMSGMKGKNRLNSKNSILLRLMMYESSILFRTLYFLVEIERWKSLITMKMIYKEEIDMLFENK